MTNRKPAAALIFGLLAVLMIQADACTFHGGGGPTAVVVGLLELTEAVDPGTAALEGAAEGAVWMIIQVHSCGTCMTCGSDRVRGGGDAMARHATHARASNLQLQASILLGGPCMSANQPHQYLPNLCPPAGG